MYVPPILVDFVYSSKKIAGVDPDNNGIRFYRAIEEGVLIVDLTED